MIYNDWKAVKNAHGAWEISEYLGDEKTAEIPSEINYVKVTGIGTEECPDYAVFSYNRMKELRIPGTIKNIKPYSFFKCSNLIKITADNENPYFFSKDGVLYDKKNRLVLFPPGRRGSCKVPSGVTAIATGAFFDSRMSKIELSETVKEIETGAFVQMENLEEMCISYADNIKPGAFAGCKNLKRFQAADANKHLVVEDGALYSSDMSILIAFPAAHKNDIIKLPDSVTAIGAQAFSYLRDKKVMLPPNLKIIANAAFMAADGVEITACGHIDKIAENAFIYTKNITVQTRNANVISAAQKRNIKIKGIEAEYMKNQKLTPAEHQTFMPQAAKAKLDEPLENEGYAKSNQQRRNECIKNFPWAALSEHTPIDIGKLSEILDAELYGMETAKRQLLRWAAIYNRTPNAPIRPLLLIGPGGVGKTSIGRALAKALNKTLALINMATIDSAWGISGTDLGYATARPGAVVQKIVEAGELPVFLFDEIDKCGRGGNYGAPDHALLSLLDDSRSRFTDIFFEVPLNLERMLIILTANQEEKINPYLLDRCAVLTLDGYHSTEERRVILLDYVIPKLRQYYNLSESEYKPADDIISEILAKSTQPEGGVRILQKNAEAVLQEAVYQLEKDNKSSVHLSLETVRKTLSETGANNQKRIGFSL